MMRCSAAVLVVLAILPATLVGVGGRRLSILEGTRLEPRPLFMKPCAKVANNALTSMSVDYAMQGRTTIVFNFNATLARSVDQWPKVKIIVDKCDETVTAASCNQFKVYEGQEVCPYMMNTVMPWAKIVADVKPKLSCPVREGVYRLDNGTLQMDMVNSLSGTLQLDGNIWHTKSFIYDAKGQMFMCFEAAAEFLRLRNRPAGNG